jgi:hypothetical protein
MGSSREIARGEAIFVPAIARRLVNFFCPSPTAAAVFSELTQREREILDLIAWGKPTLKSSNDSCSALTQSGTISQISSPNCRLPIERKP